MGQISAGEWGDQLGLGTRGVPEVAVGAAAVDDALWYRAAPTRSHPFGGLSLEDTGQRQYSGFLDDPTGSPVELAIGGWLTRDDHTAVRVSLARGLNLGIGSPAVRFVVGVGAAPVVGDSL